MRDYMEQYIDKDIQDLIMARIDEGVTWRELSAKHRTHREVLRQKYRRALSRLRVLMGDPLRDTPLGAL